MKKNPVVLVIVSLLVSVVPSIYGQSESDFKVSVDLSGEGVVIDKLLNRSAKTVVIPSKIQNFPVREIGEEAFYVCLNVTSVTIPEGVTRIGEKAFIMCSNLETINLPSTLKPGRYTIGDNAFWGCSKLPLTTQAALRKLGYEGQFNP
jgi:hypothetical protein